MRVENVNTSGCKPSFKKMIIAKPEIWPAEILDTFVKNKEVQELTKDFAGAGKDLTAACICGDRRCLVTLFKGLDLVHSVLGESVPVLQKNVETFSRKDLKINLRSGKEQKRLDDINRYVDEFNKSLEEKEDNPTKTPSQPAKQNKKTKSFWKKLFNF